MHFQQLVVYQASEKKKLFHWKTQLWCKMLSTILTVLKVSEVFHFQNHKYSQTRTETLQHF